MGRAIPYDSGRYRRLGVAHPPARLSISRSYRSRERTPTAARGPQGSRARWCHRRTSISAWLQWSVACTRRSPIRALPRRRRVWRGWGAGSKWRNSGYGVC